MDSENLYSDVTVTMQDGFRMARYVIISPNPEDDVNDYMLRWAKNSGLLQAAPDAVRIGWDFPFVPEDLQRRFGLRGYVAAYLLPPGFATSYPGVEYAEQPCTEYAVVTAYDPFKEPWTRIPGAYRRIMAHLNAKGFRQGGAPGPLACFERVYEKDGVTCMDVFIRPEALEIENPEP